MNSNSGTYVLYVGGSWNAYEYYGAFYFNAKNRASGAYASIGSRHLV